MIKRFVPQSRKITIPLQFALLAILSLVLGVVPAVAQLAGKGAISGTIYDKSGAVIPNATVTATNTANGISASVKSSGSGDYLFSNLNPGIYNVTISAQGFQKLTQQNLHVNALETQTYNPVMSVGAQDQQVTVTAAPPQLETTNAMLGATMEQQTYAELPLEMGANGSPDQRRATDFVYLMPGVQGNETKGNATINTGVVNGSGSQGAVSDVYIDGLPFVRAGGQGDPRYVWTAISVDAIDQFQLETSGYPAIYEGQGVMNYTVKQGGSNFHGSVYEFFRNTALDTWGFFSKQPDPIRGVPVKPVEHSNEYGINLSGPLIPFGGLKNKLFFFTNYNGFRYSSSNPTQITFPTVAEMNGDFSAFMVTSPTNPNPIVIYDPSTQAACTANSTTGPCRYAFGQTYAGTPGPNGHPAGNPTNIVPANEISPIALNMESFLKKLPAGAIGNSFQNNFIAQNFNGLTNWSTTSRIDYQINPHDTFSVIGAVGRQASSVPAGQSTNGRNVGPVPYNYGQAYAPKTAVWMLEETHTFSPNLLNQIKWGYARYNGPTFNPDDNPTYAASAMGISGLPQGQAQNVFPIVTFSGTDAPTGWNGATESTTVAENYTLLDNVQWNHGKHSFTFGGQIAWMLYNVVSATGGSTPITLAASVNETAGLTGGKVSAASGTGLAYASFLLGQIDKGSFTQYLQNEFGARFRAISPYVQDDWKVTPKLTLNLGLRYDYFPTVTEIHNAQSFFDPNLANPVTGINGALQFTGHGPNTCNCSTPVNNYYKNFGPRLGLAYELDQNTVLRASYGVMFSHGNAIGGGNTSLGTLGYSAAPSFSANSGSLTTTMTGLLAGGSGAIPSYTGATGAASGPAYGTGYYGASGTYSGTPSGTNYDDPYLGGRAPEFLNWTFGIQHQLNNSIALNITYVGSQGHFLQLDSYHARGVWSNDLDPKYLTLGSHLFDSGNAIATDCATYGLPCPANFNTKQNLAAALKPFPFHSVSDNLGYVGNTNYNALQALLSTRNWRGLTVNVNYTWSRAIDDNGYFRTGYAIPAGLIYNNPTASYAPDRIERSVSTGNQPHHFVTTAVWAWPFGRTVLAENPVERAIMGGFTFSGVFQGYSGSPLMITNSKCTSSNNPALTDASHFCPPSMNPNFGNMARINGRWGHGVTLANIHNVSFINSNAFINTPDFMFGNAPRTAPDNIYGPGNYQLDLALVRTFPLHITEATRLNFRAEWYNVTNHTKFGVASTAWGNSSFGQVTSDTTANRKAAQFSARISF